MPPLPKDTCPRSLTCSQMAGPRASPRPQPLQDFHGRNGGSYKESKRETEMREVKKGNSGNAEHKRNRPQVDIELADTGLVLSSGTAQNLCPWVTPISPHPASALPPLPNFLFSYLSLRCVTWGFDIHSQIVITAKQTNIGTTPHSAPFGWGGGT